MVLTDLVSSARDRAADALDRATDAVSSDNSHTPGSIQTAIDRTTTRLAEHSRRIRRPIVKAVITGGVATATLVRPVLAQPEGCTVPSDLQPVFDLLNSITQATAAIGIAGATLGIVLAGIFYMMPGPDNTRRAKSTIVTTLVGVAIILLANAIVSFVTGQMGNTVCTAALLLASRR